MTVVNSPNKLECNQLMNENVDEHAHGSVFRKAGVQRSEDARQ